MADQPVQVQPGCGRSGRSELSAPQRRTVTAGRPEGLDGHRMPGGPERIPGRGSAQQHRRVSLGQGGDHLGMSVGDLVQGPGDEPRVTQQRLPDSQPGGGRRIGVASQPSEIEGDRRSADRRQRPRRDGRGGPGPAVTEIEQVYAAVHGVRDLLGQRSVDLAGLGQQTTERGIGSVVTEQVGDDPVRHPETTGQQRPVLIFDDDQALADQWSAGLQAAAGLTRQVAGPGQLQCEADRSPPPGDVVVQVTVEPLEPRVQVRQQRGDQQLGVQGGQSSLHGQPTKSYVVAVGRGGGRLVLDPVQRGPVQQHRFRPVADQQSGDGVVGEVQTSERVVGGGIELTSLGDERPHPLLDQGGTGQQVA